MIEETKRKTGRIFISYSRIDKGFADELHASLINAGYDAFIDEKDIEPGEPWRERLAKLILRSDVVVFILTPESARSVVCRWEVDEASKHKKRILPVVLRRIASSDAPPEISRLNFIYFDRPEDFGHALANLERAIDIDLPWLREHTRLSELATSWELNNRRASDLLRGPALEHAERWMALRPDDAPGITDAQRLYIEAGQRLAIKLRRNLVASLVVIAVAVLLAFTGALYGAYRDEVNALARWTVHGRPMARDHFAPYRLASAGPPGPFARFRECSGNDYCPEMEVMPGTRTGFAMGYVSADRQFFRRDQTPRSGHVIIDHAYAIARTSVSETQWFNCVRSGICRIEPGDIPGPSRQPTRPMRGLSKAQADQFVEWLSRATGHTYRLPSEAEYEYATRAGSQTLFPWGDKFDPTKSHCRFDSDCEVNHLPDEPVPPERFPPNNWGLYDMNGNVLSWMADCYTPNLNLLPSGGQPRTVSNCTTFAIRGGSFLTTKAATSSFRIDYTMGSKPRNLGMRVVRLFP